MLLEPRIPGLQVKYFTTESQLGPHSTKKKTLADNITNIAQIKISVFDRIENIVGKGENGSCQYVFPFLKFSKGFIFRVILTQDCVVKGKWDYEA